MANVSIEEWHHLEPMKLAKVDEAIIHKQICFENLKPFKVYIKSLCKDIPQAKFCADIDFINDANS